MKCTAATCRAEMVSVLTLTLTLTLTLSPGTDAADPGFVVRLTQKGLDYARDEGMSVLQQQLAKIHLPDFSGSTHIKHMGTVKYSFDSMAVRSFQLPSSQISLVPGVGLKLTISGAFIQVDGQWKISYIHMWLVDLFQHNIEKDLRKAIEDQICPLVSESITTKLEPLLQTLPVTAKIDGVAAIDYSLTGTPLVMSEFVDVPLKGEFFNYGNRSAPPFSPPALSFPAEHSLMVYFGASEYLFNTAGYVYQMAGKLSFTITDDMVRGGGRLSGYPVPTRYSESHRGTQIRRSELTAGSRNVQYP
uniref:Bactericidal permeability-increasing protein n=1 Tax=Leptobrachium leishanense TaxID=445787 RepID=A0A8C5QCT6_9ANUR